MKFSVDSEKHIIVLSLGLFELLLNRGRFSGSILMDFSKAYDCLKDDLLLVKFQLKV